MFSQTQVVPSLLLLKNAFDVALDTKINKDIMALSDDTPFHVEISNPFQTCATVHNQVFDAALHVQTVTVKGLDSSDHLNDPVLSNLKQKRDYTNKGVKDFQILFTNIS